MQPQKNTEKVIVNRYPWYAARFWDGMRMSTWWNLLRENRFAFSPSRFPAACMTFIANPINSLCFRWQEFRWRNQVEQISIDQPPLFVLGHWRSGTTLLHELLSLDPRHAFPTTYDCFAPNHFLSTRSFMTRWFRFLMPEQRPMDNMLAGWDQPQEEEFALLNMGVPTIYRTTAFPNHGPVNLESLDFCGFTESEIENWKSAYMWFLQRLFFREHRPLVLKSPPHLGRVRTLIDLFPRARFVHIVRDPTAVFPSALRLWKSLFETQSLQVPEHKDLEQFVYSVFSRLYETFEKDRSLIPSAQYTEIRYEQLADQPLECLHKIYADLEIADFSQALPNVETYLDSRQGYQTNRYELDPETLAQIRERWAGYIERYGY
tara:strand:- start:53 stop:1180 length:1128 start_codon:yes stop_codon:yes gene_type:complete